MKSNILLGQPFSLYLQYIEKNLVSDNDEKTADNFLSVIYMSEDGLNTPLNVYRKYSYQVLKDLDTVSRVEVHLLNRISKITEYQKVQHEASRLSQTSGSS